MESRPRIIGNAKIMELWRFTADNKEERIIAAALAEPGEILIGIGEVAGALEFVPGPKPIVYILELNPGFEAA